MLTTPDCDPEVCPYAKGYFLRLPAAMDTLLSTGDFSFDAVQAVAEANQVCPFELGLSLSEIADVVIGDYNYAFDPIAHVQRIFDTRRDMTLLMDESHNLLSRVRDMLSEKVDAGALRQFRKPLKRSSPLYKALSDCLMSLSDMEPGVTALTESPLPKALEGLSERLLDDISAGAATQAHFDIYMALKVFLGCHAPDTHCCLVQGGARTRRVTSYCLSVAEHISRVTTGVNGCVFFSATLSPLSDMKLLLGGEEGDALFSTPSPFDPERFLVKRVPLNTRYQAREASAQAVADTIRMAFLSRQGNYIAFFPSFAYLNRVCALLSDLPLLCQTSGMDEAAREAFLDAFKIGTPVLGACVLGGLFAEGIDLPGAYLSGVMLVGVGLPQVNDFTALLRDYYEKRFGAGFRYAYQIPGMHKVLQAAGRVIRTTEDLGIAVLIDDRFYQSDYVRLCPPHLKFKEGALADALKEFWNKND